MLKAILSHQQRPRVGDLLRALENNPELAADAAKKVVAGLHALKGSSTFVRFAVSRYLRAVRIVQLMARRMLAGNVAMRMRALQEWTKRQEHAWKAGIATVRRPPSDAIRVRVVCEEFTDQRRRFAVVWRTWRKVQLSILAQRQDVTAELHALTLRQGHSVVVVKHLQDRMTYLNSRLQHHESALPQFRGMEVDLAALEARVAVVMHKEASERVHDAMGTIGVRAEDPAFLDAVVRRYEEALEQEYTRSRLTRSSWRRRARGGSTSAASPTPPEERHRASIALAQAPVLQPSLQVLIPQQPADDVASQDAGKLRGGSRKNSMHTPTTSPRPRLVRVDSLLPPSTAALPPAADDASNAVATSPKAAPSSELCSSGVRFLDSSASFRLAKSASILTPSHQQRFQASTISTTSTADAVDGGSAPTPTSAGGRRATVSVKGPCPPEEAAAVGRAEAAVVQPAAATAAVAPFTDNARACFQALGIGLDVLSVPVEAPGGNRFAACMRSALGGGCEGAAATTMGAEANPPPPPSVRLASPEGGKPRPRRIVVKQLPSVPPRAHPHRAPADISTPRLNHAAQLRKASPLRARVLTSVSTIAERFGDGNSGDSNVPLFCLTEDEKAALRRQTRSSSGKRKAPTQTNLQACRAAWRQRHAEESGHISVRPPVEIPPVHRLEDMVSPSPPPNWTSPFCEEEEEKRCHTVVPHLPTATDGVPQAEGLVVVEPHPTSCTPPPSKQHHLVVRHGSATTQDAGCDAGHHHNNALQLTNNIVIDPPQSARTVPKQPVTCGAMTITSTGSLLVHGMAPKAFGAQQKPPPQPFGAAAARASSSAKPTLLPVGSLPRLPRVVNTMCILHPTQQPTPRAAGGGAPPPLPSSGPADSFLAVACSDGSIRVYSLADMDTCVFADCPASREGIHHIVACQGYMCAACDDHCTYTYRYCGSDALAGSNGGGAAVGGGTLAAASWQRAHGQSSPHPPANRRQPTGLTRRSSGLSSASASAAPASPAAGGFGTGAGVGLGGSNNSNAAMWVLQGKQHHGTDITSIVPYAPRSDASMPPPSSTTPTRDKGQTPSQRRPPGGAGAAMPTFPLAPPPLLIVTTYESDVVIWNVAEGVVYARLQGHTQGVHYCFTSATTGSIVTCSYDSTVRLWDLVPPTMDAPPSPDIASPSRHDRAHTWQDGGGPDDNLEAVAGTYRLFSNIGFAGAEEAGAHYSTTVFTHHRKAVLYAVDVAGERTLCSVSRDDTICVWDQLTLEPLCVVAHIPGHRFVGCAAFPSLNSVAMLFGDGSCRVYSTVNGKQIHCINIPTPQCVTRVTRGGLLAACSTSGRISVISADTGEVVASDTKIHVLGITCVLPFADDNGTDAATHGVPLLVTGSEDRTVRVSHIQRLGPETRQIASGQQRRSSVGLSGGVDAMAQGTATTPVAAGKA